MSEIEELRGAVFRAHMRNLHAFGYPAACINQPSSIDPSDDGRTFEIRNVSGVLARYELVGDEDSPRFRRVFPTRIPRFDAPMNVPRPRCIRWPRVTPAAR